jgi:uncharacterized protein YjbI with pentapeptide repeats
MISVGHLAGHQARHVPVTTNTRPGHGVRITDITDLTQKVILSPELSAAKPQRSPIAWTPASRRRIVAERHLASANTQKAQERLADAVGKLKHDSAAVRLAAVHALARFADEDPAHRQACIDILCSAVRAVPVPRPDKDDREKGGERWRTWRGDRACRHAILSVIAAHLRAGAAISWRGSDLDFSGVVFDSGEPPARSADGMSGFTGAGLTGAKVSFAGAQFTGGAVSFAGAQFTGAKVSFAGARFTGAKVSFAGAKFAAGEVSFAGAKFAAGEVNFAGAKFSGAKVTLLGAEFTGGGVSFTGAEFAGGKVSFCSHFAGGAVAFLGSRFTGGAVSFLDAEFTGGAIGFLDAEFTGGEVSFVGAVFAGSEVSFVGAEFTGTTVNFVGAKFAHGMVSFVGAEFTGGEVKFRWAEFSGSEVRFSGASFDGGQIDFAQAKFGGGEVDFTSVHFSRGLVDLSGAIGWSAPPSFDDWITSPACLQLPARSGLA